VSFLGQVAQTSDPRDGAMHELSIAMSIVDAAANEAARHGAARVHAVHLKLGALSGVVKEALLFSFEIACDGTVLQDSRLLIEEIPVVVYCPQCRDERTLASIQRFCCPDCGALTPAVIRGKELQVVGIEIDSEAELPAMLAVAS